MADLDLDIINGKQKTVKIFGEEIKFKNLTVQEHFENEFRIKELDSIPLISDEAIKQAMDIIKEYLIHLLEITPENASKVTIDQFKALQKYLERKELYDQGFTDRDIDLIEKKQIKKAISQK